MGVLLTKFNIFHKPKPIRPAVTSYSWSNRQELGLSKGDFIIENVTNDHKWKLPGSINGQQFVIQNCTDSDIYVFDFTNTVTIDDCTRCTVVIGPVKRRSFSKSDLNVWNNIWYRVHDYTPATTNDDFNWSLSDLHPIQLRSKLPDPIIQLNASTDGTNFVVPLTRGVIKLRQNNYENCLVVFCDDFSASSFLLSLGQINVIRKTCETALFYVSPASNMASHQVNTFFSIADLQMDMCT